MIKLLSSTTYCGKILSSRRNCKTSIHVLCTMLSRTEFYLSDETKRGEAGIFFYFICSVYQSSHQKRLLSSSQQQLRPVCVDLKHPVCVQLMELFLPL